MTKDPKQQKRQLGRGLSALLGGDDVLAATTAPEPAEAATAAAQRQGTRELPIEKLHPGRYQPRRHFDREELTQLANSIRTNGIVQPILVRAHPDRPGEFEIVAGERRWRAAQLAQLHTVPVIEKPLDDRAALELSLIENVQRADLTPIEEAEGYQRLIDEFRNTQETLARDLGKSRSHIANLLRLLTLPEPVKRMVDAKEISTGHARALVGRRDAVALAQRIVSEGLTVRQVEQIVHDDAAGRAPATPKGGGRVSAAAAYVQGDANIAALERDMSLRIGMRVTIRDRGKKGGDFTIHYENLDQVDDIITKLSEPRPVT